LLTIGAGWGGDRREVRSIALRTDGDSPRMTIRPSAIEQPLHRFHAMHVKAFHSSIYFDD